MTESMMTASRVVLLSLDAFPHHALTPELTPRLWALAATGGYAPDGGYCPLPSATYTCHGSLLSGRLPEAHGIWSGLAATPKPGVVPGWAGRARVGVPTLFDACRAARMRSAAIIGDQHLYAILGAATADLAWPPGGTIPAGATLCADGYLTNEAVRPHLLAAVADPSIRFLFGHLNETDTFGHIAGPDHPETLAACTATDTIVGEAIDRLRDDWARTVVIVLSDHGMAPFPGRPPIDGMAYPAVAAVIDEMLPQGGCALARSRQGVDIAEAGERLMAIPGVAGWRAISPDLMLVEGAPGQWFGTSPPPALKGFHGGSEATRTLAVVGGGHSDVGRIARAIETAPPDLIDWAPTIASLLGITMPEPDGRDLTDP